MAKVPSPVVFIRPPRKRLGWCGGPASAASGVAHLFHASPRLWTITAVLFFELYGGFSRRPNKVAQAHVASGSHLEIRELRFLREIDELVPKVPVVLGALPC